MSDQMHTREPAKTRNSTGSVLPQSQSGNESVIDLGAKPLLEPLKGELHALVGEVLGPEETVQDVAQREFIYDASGKVVTDVRFISKTGESVTLKDELPGLYTIVITHHTPEDVIKYPSLEGSQDLNLNKVYANDTGEDANEDNFRLTVFHEAGHAVDMIKNRDEYKKLIRRILLAQVKRYPGTHLALNLNDPTGWPNPFALDNIERWRNTIKKESKGNFSDEEVAEMIGEFTEALTHVQSGLTIEQVGLFRQEQDEEFIRAYLEYEAKSERRAWAEGLGAIRRMRRRGVNPLAASDKEIFQAIDESLATRNYLLEDIDTDVRFVKAKAKK